MSTVAPRIVNDISYVTRINDASHFSLQVQHLVIFECRFSWQAQHLVILERHRSWQAQYMVILERHFLWQAQYSVKSG